MTYEHFTGCATFDEVKTRYKQLAIKLHPDTGGSHGAFVVMKAEYDLIIKAPGNHVFPLGNAKKKTGNSFSDSDLEDLFKKARWKAEEPFKDFRSGPSGKKFTEEQKETNYFVRKESEEYTYSMVRDAYNDAMLMNKATNWMLMEVFKIEGLGLDNFKHLAWLIKRSSAGKMVMPSSWVTTTYQSYVAVWSIKWTF